MVAKEHVPRCIGAHDVQRAFYLAYMKRLRTKSMHDAQMCIWRDFGADAPHGTLNIYQIRRLLQKAGASKAEIGCSQEVYEA